MLYFFTSVPGTSTGNQRAILSMDSENFTELLDKKQIPQSPHGTIFWSKQDIFIFEMKQKLDL
jgi:hypothetical protein